MLTFRLLVFAVFLAAPAAAQTPWYRVSDSTKGPHQEFIDPRLQVVPGGIATWIKVEDLTAPDTLLNGKHFTQSLSRYVVNCATREFAVTAAVYYNRSHDVLFSNEIPPESYVFSNPIPDTIGEFHVNLICAVAREMKLVP